MTTFSQIILECPNCHGRSQAYETMSYHIHSSVVFSDGKVESTPPTPFNERILICPECDKPFWREDAKVKNLLDEDENNNLVQTKDIHDLPFTFENDVSEKMLNYYLDLLETGFATSTEKEVFLRLEIWHLFNNKIRNKPRSIFSSLKKFDFKYTIRSIENHKKARIEFNKNKEQFDINLNKLISIFKPEFNEQKLLLAEMYRELGKYNKAVSLLNEFDDKEKSLIYSEILKACKGKRKEVFRINKK